MRKIRAGGAWLAVGVLAVGVLGGCGSTKHGESPTEFSTLSDQTDLQKRANIRLQLALGYFERGQLPIALDEIKLALQAYPEFADAYGLRALVYMTLKENALADDNFQKALKLAPGNPDLANNYGWFLCQNGREQQSLPYFESALKNRNYQAPAKALHNAGVCSAKLKNFAAAENYFAEAFKYDPANVSVNLNLAKIYYDREDFQRARFYAGRAAKADAAGPDAFWLAIKIERKLGDRLTEASLASQLRRKYPNSSEFASFERGAFNE